MQLNAYRTILNTKMLKFFFIKKIVKRPTKNLSSLNNYITDITVKINNFNYV